MAVKVRSEDLAQLMEVGQHNIIGLVAGDDVEFFGVGNASNVICFGVEEVFRSLQEHFERLGQCQQG